MYFSCRDYWRTHEEEQLLALRRSRKNCAPLGLCSNCEPFTPGGALATTALREFLNSSSSSEYRLRTPHQALICVPSFPRYIFDSAIVPMGVRAAFVEICVTTCEALVAASLTDGHFASLP